MENSISVHDNFLEYEKFLEIENAMNSRDFPWYYQNTIVYDNQEELNDPNTYQFVHLFFEVRNGGICSNFYSILEPVITKLNAKVILRAKSNLLTKNENPKYFAYHTDFTYPTAKTAIYYINTNNGCTIFEDGTEVQSVKNRMVIFDNHIKHTGKTCSDESTRVLVNFNYYDYLY
jgi:hypothetical protein